MRPSKAAVSKLEAAGAAAAAGEASGENAVVQQGDSALVAAKRNFNYLISPTNSKNNPARFRTRALLRTFRYIGVFVFWRLVRWAKYAAIASLIAAVGATAFGSVVSGAAFVIAPTGIMATVLSFTVWRVGKFGARRLHNRWKQGGGDTGEAIREQQSDQSPLRREGTYGQTMGPQAVPW